MKHVWILNHYAQEPGGAGGTRHFHLAQHLSNFGWQASIVAASVDHVSGKQRLNKGESTRYESIENVPFLWISVPGHSGNGVARGINMIAYALQVCATRVLSPLPKPDILVGSSVHPFAALAAAILARRHRVPFVFEVRDLWPQTLIDLGRLKENSLLTWVLRRLELWLYREAAKIIVLLPRAREYIVPLGISEGRLEWIPNGVDLSLFPKPHAATTGDEFTLMYFGAHGNANGLDNILLAMRQLHTMPNAQHIRLRMIGDGPMKPYLLAQALSLGLQNVTFEPPVPKCKIPSVAMEADAFVFNLVDAAVFRYGISSNKLFDYMAAMRPVIIASDATNNPIADAQAGLTVRPGDPEALANAIVQMSKLPLEDRQRMGVAGRDYVEQNHSFELLAERLANTLDSVCRNTDER
jgi:glycosyltransferase involved in cell wall biosynthesis